MFDNHNHVAAFATAVGTLGGFQSAPNGSHLLPKLLFGKYLWLPS